MFRVNNLSTLFSPSENFQLRNRRTSFRTIVSDVIHVTPDVQECLIKIHLITKTNSVCLCSSFPSTATARFRVMSALSRRQLIGVLKLDGKRVRLVQNTFTPERHRVTAVQRVFLSPSPVSCAIDLRAIRCRCSCRVVYFCELRLTRRNIFGRKRKKRYYIIQ